jgi:UDP-glucose 4-epimerase
MSRILVTGGSGYIGSRVCAELAARADVEEVVNVDVKPPPALAPAKVRWVNRSVTEKLDDLCAGIDTALHLAWNVDPLRDPMKQREICIGGTNRFLDACLAGGVKHLLFMSSATAYGAHPDHAHPVDESEPLKDHYHFQYSREKQEAEGLCRRFAADRPGTLLQIVRPVIVGGPNVSNFIFRSMDRSLSFRAIGKDPPIQLVHEDDAAAAVVAIVASRLPGAFNLAADGQLTVSQMYSRLGARVATLPLHALLGIGGVAWRRGWVKVAEAPPDFIFFAAFPWLVSNRRLKEEVGYKLKHDAEQTLATFLAAKRRSA